MLTLEKVKATERKRYREENRMNIFQLSRKPAGREETTSRSRATRSWKMGKMYYDKVSRQRGPSHEQLGNSVAHPAPTAQPTAAGACKSETTSQSLGGTETGER